MKRFGLVHLKYVYKLIGRGIDLYAELKEEFDEFAEKKKTKENEGKEKTYVEVETIENER